MPLQELNEPQKEKKKKKKKTFFVKVVGCWHGLMEEKSLIERVPLENDGRLKKIVVLWEVERNCDRHILNRCC